MPDIVISTSSFDVDGNAALKSLRAAGYRVLTNPHRRRLNENEISELLTPETVGIIAGLEPLNERVFARAPALRVVSRCGTGVDNIDLAAAARRAIKVLNTPDAPVAAVAELTLALMLACLRQLPEADRRMRAGEWPRMEGDLLGARCVGIVGLGRIGKRVAGLCRAFGTTVTACDPAPTEVPEGVKLADFDSLLAGANLITLHAPAAPAARPLIDAVALARMPRGAILINTARGSLVDIVALKSAIDSGHLAGAGLDAFEPEPYQGELLACRQVVLSPHLGSSTRETRNRMEFEAAVNLEQALRA